MVCNLSQKKKKDKSRDSKCRLGAQVDNLKMSGFMEYY